MQPADLLLIFGTVFSVSAYVLYGAAIRRDVVEPNRASWLIWSGTTLVEAMTYGAVNVYALQTIVFFVSALACLLVTAAIWRHGRMGRPTFSEAACIALSAASVAIWLIFRDAWWAHLVVLAAIPISFYPTWASAWRNPASEQSPAWGLWTIGDALVLGFVLLQARSAATELPFVVFEFASHAAVWLLVGLGSVMPGRTLRFVRGRIFSRRIDRSTGRPFLIGRTRVGKSVAAGWQVRKNEVLTRFRGPVLPRDALPDRRDGERDRHVQIGPDHFMGPSGDIDDLINHSCAPNTALFFNGDAVYLIALRDIGFGEEVCWDYATTMIDADWSMPCLCGSRFCRGIVGDSRSIPAARQSEYRKLEMLPDYVLAALRPDEVLPVAMPKARSTRAARRGTWVRDLWPRAGTRRKAGLDAS